MRTRVTARRQPPSIRALTVLAAVTFAVLAVGAIGLLSWTSSVEERGLDEVIVHSRYRINARELQHALLHFQAVANAERVGENLTPGDSRERAERALLAAIERSVAATESSTQRALAERAAERCRAFVADRNALDEAQLPLDEVVRRVRPSLNDALAATRELSDYEAEGLREARDAVRETRELSLLVSIVGIVVLLGILALFVVTVQRHALRPILAIREAIERNARGDLDARAPERGPRELRAIAEALNGMSEAIARQRQEQLAFVAGVAHDLRGPVTAVKIGVDAIRDDHVAAQSPVIAIVERNCARLTRMLDDLVTASRIEAGFLELAVQEIDLRVPVRAIVDLYAPTSPRHRIALRAPDEPVRCNADPMRVEQVVSNLLSNAIKYSPNGGDIEVSIERGRDEATLTVRDHGIGIDRDELDHIFEPFTRRLEAQSLAPGAGVGLSVVRRIVDAHGGRLEVESAKGAGSTFRVTWPAQRVTSAPGIRAKVDDNPPRASA